MKLPEPRKLPSGSWFVRVRVDGKDISITRATKKECLTEATAIKMGIVTAKRSPSSTKLRNAYTMYIELNEGILSPSTIAGYKRLARNTFQALMDFPLNRITPLMIQKEVSKMSKEGKSPKYIRNAVGLLSPVIASVDPNFKLDVTLPKKKKPDLRMLEDGEITKIMVAAKGTAIELPILFALWLGMRMSEIRGLKFKDIRNGKIHVCRAIVDDEKGLPAEKGTKSYAGDRWLSVPDYILSILPDGNPDAPIVPLSGQAIYKRFSRLLDKAGVEHCRFHDLRRANAAAMIRLGVDSKYAQQRNGWASDYMYKQVYAYTMSDHMDAVNTAMEEYFGNKLATNS